MLLRKKKKSLMKKIIKKKLWARKNVQVGKEKSFGTRKTNVWEACGESERKKVKKI